MVEGYDYRYNYSLLESMQSIEPAEEIFDYELGEYNYVWLSDNETLPESEKECERENKAKEDGRELFETSGKEIDSSKAACVNEQFENGYERPVFGCTTQIDTTFKEINGDKNSCYNERSWNENKAQLEKTENESNDEHTKKTEQSMVEADVVSEVPDDRKKKNRKGNIRHGVKRNRKRNINNGKQKNKGFVGKNCSMFSKRKANYRTSKKRSNTIEGTETKLDIPLTDETSRERLEISDLDGIDHNSKPYETVKLESGAELKNKKCLKVPLNKKKVTFKEKCKLKKQSYTSRNGASNSRTFPESSSGCEKEVSWNRKDQALLASMEKMSIESSDFQNFSTGSNLNDYENKFDDNEAENFKSQQKILNEKRSGSAVTGHMKTTFIDFSEGKAGVITKHIKTGELKRGSKKKNEMKKKNLDAIGDSSYQNLPTSLNVNRSRNKDKRSLPTPATFRQFENTEKANTSATRKKSADKKDVPVFKRRYNKRKSQEVKIQRTVKGIGKIMFRYPCKFCGELFSKDFISRHEKKHLTEGCQDTCQTTQGKTTGDIGNPGQEESVSYEDCSTSERDTLGAGSTEEAHSALSRTCNEDSRFIMTTSLQNATTVPSQTEAHPGDAHAKQIHKDVKSYFTVTKSSEHYSCKGERKQMSSMTESLNTQQKSEKKTEKECTGEVKGVIRSKLYGVRYSCKMCSYSSPHKMHLTRHSSVHDHRIKSVNCKCGITFRNQLTLIQWHKRNNIRWCGGETVNESKSGKVRIPRRKKLNSKKQRRVVMNKSNVSKSTKSGPVKGRVRRKKCGKCNYRFSSNANWIEHERLHESNGGFTCKECSITMKTKGSLAFWHHRHGVQHHKRKQRCAKRITRNQKHGCEFDLHEQHTLNTRNNLHTEGIKTCTDCSEYFIVKDPKLGQIREKLDGTTCEICSMKIETMQRTKTKSQDTIFEIVSEVDTSRNISIDNNQSVGIDKKLQKPDRTWQNDKKSKRKRSVYSRQRINNSLTKLTSKFQSNGKSQPKETCVNKFEEIEKNFDPSFDELFEKTAEKVTNMGVHFKHSDLCIDENNSLHKGKDSNKSSFKCQEEVLKHDSKGTKGKSVTFEEAPVYPLVRKLSMKEGEQVYIPVNDEVEVFEKDYDVDKKYHKVRVINIDTDGCQEKTTVRKDSDISVFENFDRGGINPFTEGENRERSFDKPLDLSLKKCEEEKNPDSINSRISVSFEIKIDFDRNYLTSYRSSFQQINGCQENTVSSINDTKSSSIEIGKGLLTDAVRANIVLKDIQAIPQTSINSEMVQKSHYLDLKQSHSNQSEYTSTCQGSGLIEELDKPTQSYNYDVMKVDECKNDVYTFTDDESDDGIHFFASKLQGVSVKDGNISNLDQHSYGHCSLQEMNTPQITNEDYVCDAGETDENNNDKNRGDRSNDKQRSSTEGTGSKKSSDIPGGHKHDDEEDEDGKENNDNNNNSGSNADEAQNVELLPCLICQTIFNNKAALLRHLTRIHRLTNLCQICYFDEGEIRRFANPVSLRNHKVRDHPEDMVKCVCGAMLIDNKMLSSHLKKFRCDIHKSGGESKEMVKCICGKRFSSQEMLLNHRSKCRKRHSLEETCSKNVVTPSKGKKRCLKPATEENRSTAELSCMTLQAKPTDMNNNNLSSSESNESSFGRTSKVRKCKENVISYSENAYYNKYFETTNLQRTTKRKLFGEVEQTKRYEGLPCSQSLSENTVTCCNEVLDLRTKSALDRNANSLAENLADVAVKADSNFNYFVQGASKSYSDEKCDKILDEACVDFFKVGLEKGSDVQIDNANKKNKLASKFSETKSKPITEKRNTLKPKTVGQTYRTKAGKRKKVKPDAEGKYPCKICRRRFKRPYVYTHQRIAHAPKQWVLVPTASLQKKSGKKRMT